MFIDTTKDRAELRFVPWVEAGPDPAGYGLDRSMLFEGTVIAVGEDEMDCKIRRPGGAVCDLGTYTIGQDYVLSEG